MALEDGLVEFWTLNNTRVGSVAGLIASSVDGSDRYVAGVIGQGWEPLGLDDLLSVNPATGLNTGGDWTLSLWVNVTWSNGITRYHAGFYDGVTPLVRLRIRVQVGAKKLDVYVGSTLKTFAVTSSNGWRHIVVRYTAADTLLKVTLDNVSPAAQTVANPGAATSPLLWMAGYGLSFNGGAVDCVGWWNAALSDADVTELYNTGAGWEYAGDEESSSSSSSQSSTSSVSSVSSSSSSSSSASSTSSVSSVSSVSSSSSQSSSSSASSSRTSSSSASSSQSSGTVDLPRSCTVHITGSFTIEIVRPT